LTTYLHPLLFSIMPDLNGSSNSSLLLSAERGSGPSFQQRLQQRQQQQQLKRKNDEENATGTTVRVVVPVVLPPSVKVKAELLAWKKQLQEEEEKSEYLPEDDATWNQLRQVVPLPHPNAATTHASDSVLDSEWQKHVVLMQDESSKLQARVQEQIEQFQQQRQAQESVIQQVESRIGQLQDELQAHLEPLLAQHEERIETLSKDVQSCTEKLRQEEETEASTKQSGTHFDTSYRHEATRLRQRFSMLAVFTGIKWDYEEERSTGMLSGQVVCTKILGPSKVILCFEQLTLVPFLGRALQSHGPLVLL
jgi:DNA repair exonuclease SbcCD ATPase subunit